MQSENNTTKVKCLERFELSNKPTLIITKELENKIAYLHKMCGATEWSGELITREEGTINDLNDWKIIAEDIYLADIGSPGFTGYEVGKGTFKASDIIDVYESFPGLLEGTHKLHHLHSHHSMSAYFSGTDWENLNDRALVSNYFLMLIVNFDGKWCAKVAFKGLKQGNKGTVLNFANNSDGFKPLTLNRKEDDDVLVVMDCKIELEVPSVDSVFIERYNKVKTIKEEEEKARREAAAKNAQKYPHSGNKRKHYNGQQQQFNFSAGGWVDDDYDKQWNGHTNGWDDYDYVNDVWKKKDKKVMEMTEAEWRKEQESPREISSVGKFELRHAKAFLNSILDGTYSAYDYSDCIKKIELEAAQIISYQHYEEKAHEEWIDTFEEQMQDHFDACFPYNNQDDYIDLLKVVEEYLQPYRTGCELIDSIVDDVLLPEIELYSPVI